MATSASDFFVIDLIGSKVPMTTSALQPKSPPERSEKSSFDSMAETLSQVSLTQRHPLPSRPPPADSILGLQPQIPASSQKVKHARKKGKKSELTEGDAEVRQVEVKALKSKNRSMRDAKVQPSAASGGIPTVTQEYMRQAYLMPYQLREPQHLLVVLDLNGTLLYRPQKKQPTKFLMRPHAQLFLKYCLDNFYVVIWSSARPENVTAMCNAMEPWMRQKILAVWGRDKFGLSAADYNLRVQCYKRLSMLWRDEEVEASHPFYSTGGRWDQTNTVLIDDSIEKASSEPHNLIEVPEWAGDVNDAVVCGYGHSNHHWVHMLRVEENMGLEVAIKDSPLSCTLYHVRSSSAQVSKQGVPVDLTKTD